MNLGFMSFLFIDIHRKLHECNPAHEELCFHEADDKGRRPKELPLVVCPVKKDAKLSSWLFRFGVPKRKI